MRLLQFDAGQTATAKNEPAKPDSGSNDSGLTVTSHSISLRAGFISLDFNWSHTETNQKSPKEPVSASLPSSAGHRVSALRRRAELAALLDPSPSVTRQKNVSRQNSPQNIEFKDSTEADDSQGQPGNGPLAGRCFIV
ncbi:hypothetical protein [Dethiosulfatarculus sandiegensis]|uniref:Uncharacterized protein n=1 Tax=Dethiosulfatarculus sandiegensis TaxID=1429043 RepID=A0A0D2J620_9BACT|nr:hypothetical protein [Dethiosulfatarculus sandiegensis]KIX13549.1 hypothetical protein X474_13770 [Dethiosulfatarculus sandiegensis]